MQLDIEYIFSNSIEVPKCTLLNLNFFGHSVGSRSPCQGKGSFFLPWVAVMAHTDWQAR